MSESLVHTADELHAALAGLNESSHHVIRLAPGEYNLECPLRITPGQASGLTLQAADPTSPPLIHSLKPIKEWQTVSLDHAPGRKVWKCHLPNVATGNAHYRTLFANREPRPRARWPKFDLKSAPNTIAHAVPYEEGQVPKLHMGTHQIQTQPGDINPAWQHLYDAELVGLHFWTEERLPHLHFAPDSHTLTSSKRTVYRLTEGTQPLPFRYYLENLLDALSEPGEWCLIATSGDLYYLPKDGETPENTRIEVPTLHRLVEIRGSSYGDSKQAGDPTRADTVTGLRLENIQFTGTDWIPHSGHNLRVDHLVPETGHPLGASVQSAIDAVAALEISDATNLEITGCRFHHLGSHAIRVGRGCRHIRVRDNQFDELGGGAFLAHGDDVDGPPAGRTSDLFFLNNQCTGMGRVFPSACAVLGGAVRRMTIAHNHIKDTFYSGISLGWTWGYADTVSAEHLVEYNLVEDISQGVLNDLGGIYFVGRNTGTIVRRNIVRRVRTANFGARGIYLDEGCCHFLIEENIVTDAGETGINMHYGRGHLIRHNLLTCAETGIRLSRDDGHSTFTAQGNVFHEIEHPYAGGYALANLCTTSVSGSGNAFPGRSADDIELHHPPYLDHERVPFRKWQEAGNDGNALFGDLGITVEKEGSFVVNPDSPLSDIGFHSWDFSRVGPVAAEDLDDYGFGPNERRSEF